MQFHSKNTLTFLAITVLLVCVLERVPGANADCTELQLKEKTKEICNAFFFIPGCPQIAEHILKQFNVICSSANKGEENPAAAAPPGGTAKA